MRLKEARYSNLKCFVLLGEKTNVINVHKILKFVDGSILLMKKIMKELRTNLLSERSERAKNKMFEK